MKDAREEREQRLRDIEVEEGEDSAEADGGDGGGGTETGGVGRRELLLNDFDGDDLDGTFEGERARRVQLIRM